MARYGKAVARPGQGDQLAGILLAAADGLAGQPGCELYLVSGQGESPDVIWVTELWRSQGDLEDASLRQVRGSDSAARAMALVQSWDMIELDLLGGRGPRSAWR